MFDRWQPTWPASNRCEGLGSALKRSCGYSSGWTPRPVRLLGNMQSASCTPVIVVSCVEKAIAPGSNAGIFSSSPSACSSSECALRIVAVICSYSLILPPDQYQWPMACYFRGIEKPDISHSSCIMSSYIFWYPAFECQLEKSCLFSPSNLLLPYLTEKSIFNRKYSIIWR